MKPRTGYLVSQYPTVGHSFILREIRALRSRGFDLMIISVKPSDRPAGQLTSAEREEFEQTRVIRTTGWMARGGIHVRVLASRPLRYLRGLRSALAMAGADVRRAAANLRYFGEAVVAGHWLERHNYRHLHSHFTSTVALLAARVFDFRLSLTLHGPDEFTDPQGFALAEKAAAAELVCVISEFGRSQVMRFSDPRDWGKIAVIRLGVDPHVYSPGAHVAPRETFEIVSVGRLAAVKGCLILLDAVDRLAREGRNVRLRFAGEGSLRGALSAEIEKRSLSRIVKLEGSLDAAAVLALYREADLFALASFAEGIPVVLMEAMAMGIPCVATRITGIPELIRDEIDGLLVTPSSSGEMAAAIARMMDDAELRRRCGEQGRRRVMEQYDLERNTAELAGAFERLQGISG